MPDQSALDEAAAAHRKATQGASELALENTIISIASKLAFKFAKDTLCDLAQLEIIDELRKIYRMGQDSRKD